jgi:hypothetical protein
MLLSIINNTSPQLVGWQFASILLAFSSILSLLLPYFKRIFKPFLPQGKGKGWAAFGIWLLLTGVLSYLAYGVIVGIIALEIFGFLCLGVGALIALLSTLLFKKTFSSAQLSSGNVYMWVGAIGLMAMFAAIVYLLPFSFGHLLTFGFFLSIPFWAWAIEAIFFHGFL